MVFVTMSLAVTSFTGMLAMNLAVEISMKFALIVKVSCIMYACLVFDFLQFFSFCSRQTPQSYVEFWSNHVLGIGLYVGRTSNEEF